MGARLRLAPRLIGRAAAVEQVERLLGPRDAGPSGVLASAQGDEPVDRVGGAGLRLDLSADMCELLTAADCGVQRLHEALAGELWGDVASEEEAQQERVPGRGWGERLGKQVPQAGLPRRGDVEGAAPGRPLALDVAGCL